MEELKMTPRFNYGESATELQILKLKEDKNLKTSKKQSKSYLQTSKNTKTIKNNISLLFLCKKFQLRNDFDKEHCDAFLASKLQTFEEFPFDK